MATKTRIITGTPVPSKKLAEELSKQDNVAELIAMLEKVTFIAETVAHLRGLERDILPTTDAARALIAKIKGE